MGILRTVSLSCTGHVPCGSHLTWRLHMPAGILAAIQSPLLPVTHMRLMPPPVSPGLCRGPSMPPWDRGREWVPPVVAWPPLHPFWVCTSLHPDRSAWGCDTPVPTALPQHMPRPLSPPEVGLGGRPATLWRVAQVPAPASTCRCACGLSLSLKGRLCPTGFRLARACQGLWAQGELSWSYLACSPHGVGAFGPQR